MKRNEQNATKQQIRSITVDPDQLQNILLSQQLCTFRLLFAWRDNIAREEDESYG